MPTEHLDTALDLPSKNLQYENPTSQEGIITTKYLKMALNSTLETSFL